MLNEIDTYPIIRHDKYLITFLDDIPVSSVANQFEIRYLERITIKSNTVFSKNGSKNFPSYDDN
jgi:hypothetical protein